MIFVYTAFTLYGPTFQRGSTNRQIGNSTVAGPTTPAAPKWVPRQNQITVLKFTHASKQFLLLPAREPFVLITIRVQSVWAVPSSLATTIGIEVSFFSFRY
jgi:hypothetical protein